MRKMRRSIILIWLFVLILMLLLVFDSQRSKQVKIESRPIPRADCSFFLRGEITVEKADSLEAFLRAYQSDSTVSVIRVDIWSNGGSLHATLDLCQLMEEIGRNKTVITVGKKYVSSAATLILACGTYGYRFLEPETRVMIHSPIFHIYECWYTAEELRHKYQEAKEGQTLYYQLLSRRTGQSFSRIAKDCRKDYWLSAEEALLYGTYGLADWLTGTNSSK